MTRKVRNMLAAAALSTVATAGVLASSAATSVASSNGGPIPIGALGEITGPKAGFGTGVLQGMTAGTAEVNAAGGVMGRQLKLIVATDNSDPVDAVPVAQRLIELNHVVSEVGEAGASAQAIEPIFTKAHIPLLTAGGDTYFDKNTDPYLWRLTPSDSQLGVAMALYAQHKGYKTAVTMFTINAVQQALQAEVVAAFTKLGGKVLDQVNLQPDLSSYSSEVARVAALKPDAIFVEMDPGTAGVVFKDFAAAGYTGTPVVGTDDMIGSSTIQAIGVSTARQVLVNLEGGIFNSPAAGVFNTWVKKTAHGAAQPNASYGYDGMIIDALAMDLAKSTAGPAVIKAIPKVTDAGGQIVYSYAAGLKALRAGKRITYVGASGPYNYNKYHNIFGPFIAVRVDPNGSTYSTVATFTPQQLEKATP